MFESKRKIRKERDEWKYKYGSLLSENRRLKMQIQTDEKFNKNELCEYCKHFRGYSYAADKVICELEKQHCKHFE